MGNGENLISGVTRFKCPALTTTAKTKITSHTKKWENMAHSGKKINHP
jgi:hypothetical protein